MYLKSLTMKGFKSFADPTTLELEPGVTVVVGPNGSGKSNVVDAIAWVLGAQGPRVVRSAKMDDVIFAGTAKRAALGRAEVSLTIDNGARRLPVDFNEVTITRTLFRTGESEYQINGETVRLLDIQELLSDSGVGRQQHVIIGQGQLDAILTARPEDRRAVIEEAAGVLKYRRRRERSERRLEASEAALSRLQDLLREVRRQLKPLERQAAGALRHEAIASETDVLRLYLAGQEIRELTDRLAALGQEMTTADGEQATQLAALSEIDAAIKRLQDEFDANRGADLSPLIARVAQLGERSRGTRAFIGERRRARAELVSVIEDADALVAMEDELRRVVADLGETETAAIELSPQWEELGRAEQNHAEAEAEHVERFGITDADDTNPVLAAVRTELEGRRDALGKERERLARSTERQAQLAERIAEITAELTVTEDRVAAARAELQLARDVANAAAQRAATAEEAFVAEEAILRRNEEIAYGAAGRVEALEKALDELRARAGVEKLANHAGVIGTLLDVVRVDDDAVLAFSAALDGVLDSVLVDGEASARRAIEHLRSTGDGGAVIALGTHAVGGLAPQNIPAGAQALRSRVHGSTDAVNAALDALIGDVLVVSGGVEDAIGYALRNPLHTIVTTDGDRFSPRGWRVGLAGKGATRAALDAAIADRDAAAAVVARGRDSLVERRSERDGERHEAERLGRSADALAESIRHDDAACAAANNRVVALRTELEEVVASRASLDAEIAHTEAQVAATNQQLEGLERDEEAKAAHRSEALAARRSLEERARSIGALRRDLEVRAAGLEERRSMLVDRRAQITQQIADRSEEHVRAEYRRSTHAVEDLALGRLSAVAEHLITQLDAAQADLSLEQNRRSAASQERLERLSASRRERDALERTVTALRERRQRCELDATEARVRYEAAVDRLRHDLDVEPEQALVATLPETESPTDPAQRLRELERELRLLGPVNPLAREELTALEERHTFLETQLEDVRTARRELNQVIHAIDAEIVDVFTSAYADVEHHFEQLIGTLFPGGSGRLELTAPDDPLNTGVEIEARPAGRNVRRLSLLSGGERSLVAVAFLFAVFRSRPSPFYVLDEVEAALDEMNLLRFLALVEQFRDEAQLIIVSHQKKTMEVANALYGISMQPGGASKAVSESLKRSRAAVRGSDTDTAPQSTPDDAVVPNSAVHLVDEADNVRSNAHIDAVTNDSDSNSDTGTGTAADTGRVPDDEHLEGANDHSEYAADDDVDDANAQAMSNPQQ